MSDSSHMTWSDNPNAPHIPYHLYHLEILNANGEIIGAILYGIVIILFFECVIALLNPDNRMKRGVKWGLVVHTVVIFSFTTMSCAMEATKLSSAYINNRGYPGVDNVFVPGPLGYLDSDATGAMAIVGYLAIPLNQWLTDGLLLHRCYLLYSMNYWIIIFPGAMYLATVALGIVSMVNTTPFDATIPRDLFFSYNFIALSLNVLLTLMIIMRIIWHRRNFRIAVGTPAGASGLYTTVIIMLVESCAPYTIAFLLYIVPIAAGSSISNVFACALGPLQVIAPYLIILRVANRKALTSERPSGLGALGSIRFVSQGGSTGDDRGLPDGSPVRLMGMNDKVSSKPDAEVKNTIDEVPL